jgi:hypothetical protein
MQKFDLTVFADYHQFYLQDDDSRFGDLSEAWTPQATEKLLAIADHVIGVGTVRNMDVPVHITVDSTLPVLDAASWDRINMASLICDTGRIVVAGCTDYFPDALRITVAPGAYGVVVGYRGLNSLSADGLDGEDSYHVFLAPQEHVA